MLLLLLLWVMTFEGCASGEDSRVLDLGRVATTGLPVAAAVSVVGGVAVLLPSEEILVGSITDMGDPDAGSMIALVVAVSC